MSFKANPNSRDFGAVKNENAIKQAVLNLVKTDIGEKPFQYDVGSRVTALLLSLMMFLQVRQSKTKYKAL